jgi:hypothetical protein
MEKNLPRFGCTKSCSETDAKRLLEHESSHAAHLSRSIGGLK